MNKIIRELIDMLLMLLMIFLIPRLPVPTVLKAIAIGPSIFALMLSIITIISYLFFKE